MFGLMMLVFLMWASPTGAATGEPRAGWRRPVATVSPPWSPRPAGRPRNPPGLRPEPRPGRLGRSHRRYASVPRRPPARPGLAAARQIDDDEHLAAYNDYLARLNQSGHGPAGSQQSAARR